MATIPTLADVRSWLGLGVSVISDAQLQQVYDGERAAQAAVCDIPDNPAGYPAQAVEGLYRRIGRAVAARGVPLGMLGVDGEFGAARLPSTDAEITRYESTIRRVVLG
jgi:hypothetical protein